jgi:hypothetical protein
MKYVRFASWFLLIGAMFYLIQASVHVMLITSSKLLGVTPNAAMAGATTMELVATAIALIKLNWRLVWMLTEVRVASDLTALFKVRAVRVALALSGIVGVYLSSRIFWWIRRVVTQDSYNHVNFAGATNSVMMALLMCFLISATYSPPHENAGDQPLASTFGLQVAAYALAAGIVAYWAGVFLYMNC